MEHWRQARPSAREWASLAGLLKRFGRDDDARIRALIAFTERDLRGRDSCRSAVMEAMAFSFSMRVAGVRRRAALSMGRLDDVSAADIRRAESSATRVQREIVTALRTYVAQGRCQLSYRGVGAERLPDGRTHAVVGGDVWSRFRGAIVELLAQQGAKLRVCADPTCGRLFARTGRGVYCGPRCSQRERSRRFREVRPERMAELRRVSRERAKMRLQRDVVSARTPTHGRQI